LGCESLDDRIPALLEGLDALPELFILSLTGSVPLPLFFR
jgi:hypothetical protein